MPTAGPFDPTAGIRQLAAVTATELVDATCCVDHALLARIEWVTSGTDFDVEVLAKRGTGLELAAAAAVDRQRRVVGVDFRLHGGLPSSNETKINRPSYW